MDNNSKTYDDGYVEIEKDVCNMGHRKKKRSYRPKVKIARENIEEKKHKSDGNMTSNHSR